MGRPLRKDVNGVDVLGTPASNTGITVKFYDASLRTDGVLIKQRGAKTFVVCQVGNIGTTSAYTTAVLTNGTPSAAGEIFMVSDDRDLSLSELIELMAKVHKKKAQLIHVPVKLMIMGAKILGKKSYADRLFGNLQVDIEKTKQLLDWKPITSFEETFSQ